MDKMLDIYSNYLIFQNGHATATDLSDLLHGQTSPITYLFDFDFIL